ncbi:MAG: methyltransferase domain-containing protein [Erysipelotrichaceae bacterium]
MGNLRCPVCKKELIQNTHSLVCQKGHRFDRASQGYVNLTIGSKQRKSGDDKAMIAARSLFLSQGYYLPLRDKIIACLRTLDFQDALDMGCGEGYYTNLLAKQFPGTSWTGVDLSVDAVKFAAKLNRNVNYLVAGISDLPIQDTSVDLTLNIFAPIFKDEINRVLKDGGHAMFILPGENHLLELKEHLYPEIHLNPAPASSLEGFDTTFIEDLDFLFDVRCNADLKALLHMTPYVHRSPKEGLERVSVMDTMSIRASFRILCVTKPLKKDVYE